MTQAVCVGHAIVMLDVIVIWIFVDFVGRLIGAIKKGLLHMSLFKPYRIRGHNLVFTRIEALDDDYICDLCRYQEHCGHNIRGICVKTNHEITKQGHTDIYS